LSKVEWGESGLERYQEYHKQFSTSLRGIAANIAHFEESDTVSIAHVNRAHALLCESGINRVPYLKRPSTEQTFGGFLVGLAASCPDVITTLFSDDSAHYAAVIAKTVMFLFVAFGTICLFHGYHRSRLPSPPAESQTPARTAFYVVIVFFVVLGIGYYTFTIVRRATGACCGGNTSQSQKDKLPNAPAEVVTPD
jgi:uncharacterized membrane protein YtjA (UPF0391 family)